MRPGNTFGGHGMDRYVYEFEVDELAVDEVDEVAAADAAVPDAPDAAAADVVEPETPATGWTADSPEFRDAVAEEASAIAEARVNQILEQYAREAQHVEPQAAAEIPGEIDLFSDDAVPQLMGLFAQMLDERLAPVHQSVQAQQQRERSEQFAEAGERAKDIIKSFEDTSGEYVNGDTARTLVQQLGDIYVGQTSERYGFGPRAAEEALRLADQMVRQFETAAGEAYHQRKMNELRTLSGAPAEPGAAAAGTSILPEPEDEEAAALRFVSRPRT